MANPYYNKPPKNNKQDLWLAMVIVIIIIIFLIF